MRAVLQRVKSASVTVDGETVSAIGKGILVLVGVSRADTAQDVSALASKLVRVKMWADDEGRPWRRSVQEIGGEILCVSQFTLFANTKKPRPDFHRSAPATSARDLYASFVAEVARLHGPGRVRDGKFQEMMDVALVNDGPVTYILDTETTSSPSTSSTTSTSTSTPTPTPLQQASAASAPTAPTTAAPPSPETSKHSRLETGGQGHTTQTRTDA